MLSLLKTDRPNSAFKQLHSCFIWNLFVLHMACMALGATESRVGTISLLVELTAFTHIALYYVGQQVKKAFLLIAWIAKCCQHIRN
jgi:hypothetical protein